MKAWESDFELVFQIFLIKISFCIDNEVLVSHFKILFEVFCIWKQWKICEALLASKATGYICPGASWKFYIYDLKPKTSILFLFHVFCIWHNLLQGAFNRLKKMLRVYTGLGILVKNLGYVSITDNKCFYRNCQKIVCKFISYSRNVRNCMGWLYWLTNSTWPHLLLIFFYKYPAFVLSMYSRVVISTK